MNCATTGLAPYVPSEATPWDAARVQHFYRRAGYGAHLAEIDAALLEDPTKVVERLLDEAATRPLAPDPEWAYWDYEQMEAAGLEQFETYVETMIQFMHEAMDYGIREKMVLFWSNHFVAKYESHSCASLHYQYWKLLTQYAFGNFKDFVIEVTKTPAMLFFLNGFENRRESPNENYARELFELFTLGEDNGYTQKDITEASRALTGFNEWTSYCGPVLWADWGFDSTEKTVFGRTGNFNYGTLVNVLFEERAELIAPFICRKLYTFYVNPEPNEEVIAELATTFIASNWEILPVLKQLFTSTHFFDEANVGAVIKSPSELMFSFLRQGKFGDFENRDNWGFWAMANMGQMLGEPTDVAGWTGDRSWIDSNRLTLRWEFLDGFSWAVFNENEQTYLEWASELTGNSRAPEVIARAIVDFFIPKGLLDESAYELATDVLKWDVPTNYYESGEWSLAWPSAAWQITVLLRHIGRLPEFQLN